MKTQKTRKNTNLKTQITELFKNKNNNQKMKAI
jgi:hypothetical protein